MKLTLFLNLLLLLALGGCAPGVVNRSFVNQMSMPAREGLFDPNTDFRVLAGDSGKQFRNKEDILARTPQSEAELVEFSANARLRKEFTRLLQSQSDFALGHYRRHEHYLQDISEKIYFLRLSSLQERNKYLAAKGAPDSTGQVYRAYGKDYLRRGMTKGEVLKMKGRPWRKDIAGSFEHQNERWAYFDEGLIEFIYFEGGIVEGWEKAN